MTESARHVTPDHVDHSYPAPEPSDRWVPIDRSVFQCSECIVVTNRLLLSYA